MDMASCTAKHPSRGIGPDHSDGVAAASYPRLRSPPCLLLLHQLLALLTPALVHWVARVIDLEGILILHVGILHFSGVLVEMEHMDQPEFGDGGEQEGYIAGNVAHNGQADKTTH